MGVIGELFEFLWKNKKWWLIPMVLVLVIFSVLLVLASASGIAPFIYTIF
jgi:competence protein ComGC